MTHKLQINLSGNTVNVGSCVAGTRHCFNGKTFEIDWGGKSISHNPISNVYDVFGGFFSKKG